MKKIMALLATAVLAASFVSVPAGAVPPGFSEPTPPTPGSDWVKIQDKKSEKWRHEDKGNPKLELEGKLKKDPKQFQKREENGDLPIPPGTTITRNYANISQAVTSPVEGTSADITIADPYLNYSSDWHSLTEIAVQDDNGNIAEIGWTVSPTQCPSEPAGSSPCLFGFTWEGGVPQGYGVGFVDNPTGDYDLGDQLPNPNDSSGLNFRILEDSVGWWLGAGVTTSAGYWVGYFPKDNWDVALDPTSDATATFTQMTYMQLFTEIASTEAVSPTWNAVTPCTDAGNGYAPTSPNGGTQAARIINIKTLSGSTSTNATPGYGNIPSTIPVAAQAIYPTTTPATNGFRVGGPGWKGNNTLTGFRDACG